MSRAQVYLRHHAPEYLDPAIKSEKNDSPELTAFLVFSGLYTVLSSASFLVVGDMQEALLSFMPGMTKEMHLNLIFWGLANFAASSGRDLKGTRNILLVFMLQKCWSIYLFSQFHLSYNILKIWEVYAETPNETIFKYMIPMYLSTFGALDMLLVLLFLIGWWQRKPAVAPPTEKPAGKKD